LATHLGRHRRFAGRACLVPRQAFNALFRTALLPAPHRRAAHAGTLGDGQHGETLAGAEDDARTLDVLERAIVVGNDRGQVLAITGREHHARGLGHTPRLTRHRLSVNPPNASMY
jgi:hypothetical protein